MARVFDVDVRFRDVETARLAGLRFGHNVYTDFFPTTLPTSKRHIHNIGYNEDGLE